MHGAARGALRWLVRLAIAAVLIVATALVVIAFFARDMPALRVWHHVPPEGEFRARDAVEGFTFDDYLRQEQRLFAGLSAYQVPADAPGGVSDMSRYAQGGPDNPLGFEHDWNRTTELVPDEIRGGVLLLHGLSDSPYSMRSMAELFRDQGFYALCLRLPGHGTVPAGLLDVQREDWEAAVRLAAQHVASRIGDDAPFFLCGYSNGGALAVLYTLDSLEQDPPGLAVPDRLVLFSPCIGISAFAIASNWHRVLSWMPCFEQSRWLTIEPEFDPYKYNSFPKNAGAQAWNVTERVQQRLDVLAEQGRLTALPPILAFQSLVDATVIMEELVSRLFDRLDPNGSELVLFDVNRASRTHGFLTNDKTGYLAALEQRDDLPYRLTVVANSDEATADVVARTKELRSGESATQGLDLLWPIGVYSLAHVAIPFPEDDPLYGVPTGAPVRGVPNLGALAPRGEVNVLTVPASQLLRLRHNPFHAYMARRVTAILEAERGN